LLSNDSQQTNIDLSLRSLNTITTTYGVEYSRPGIGQEQKCDGVKPFNAIPPSLYNGTPTAIQSLYHEVLTVVTIYGGTAPIFTLSNPRVTTLLN
jgi:hypothetical protein